MYVGEHPLFVEVHIGLQNFNPFLYIRKLFVYDMLDVDVEQYWR